MPSPKPRYSVLVMDMFHYQNPDEEYTIEGFATFELAMEFARKFVRCQIEEARAKGKGDTKGLREGWFGYGEDALVLGGGDGEKYSGSQEIDFFIANPVPLGECDYESVLKRAGIKTPWAE